MEKQGKKRETFSSGLAIFFATLGSAVGLGNIWKFPYLAGKNGGGAFVFLYLICVLLLGIPIAIGELYIGRKSRKNAVGAFKALKEKPFWSSIGCLGIVSAFFIMFFYSTVAGYVYSYVFKALTGSFANLKNQPTIVAVKTVGNQFDATVGSLMPPVFWQFVALLLVTIVLLAGVKKGIEKVTKTLMPILFILIIICDIRALTLPKASAGLSFLFDVHFSEINIKALVTALGLAFFKLSVGMGTMITYGSYFTKDNNLLGTSVKVALSDTLISLLAGIAIFPAVFQYGMEPAGGPGLLFKTIPMVFSQMPFGNILLLLFFMLTAIAATTAMISLVEVIVVFLNEETGLTRTAAVLATTSSIFIVGALTVNPASLFGSIKLMGKSFFDIFDSISSNMLLPLGGLLIAIYVGYVAKKEDITLELSNNGTLNNIALINIILFMLRYVSPFLLILVFLTSVGVIKI